ncbi:MAG: glycosyltransferase, partial [Candidatus Eisenbacteria bacterium]|nr:glycosyltransferase [Candidatus Eisenbacteria bacterium]
MKIAFIGQKGIPVTFGGVEYHVDALATGLAARGEDVSVYVRSWYTPRKLQRVNGVRLLHLATIRTKHLDASVHSLLCSLHVLFAGADIVHYHGIGPAVFSLIPRLFGTRVVVTVHRLDWQTEKWGRIARWFLRLGEYLAVRIPDRTIVVSEDLQRHFRECHGKETVHISHGIELPHLRAPGVIREKHG